jgi:hypothetical protein
MTFGDAMTKFGETVRGFPAVGDRMRLAYVELLAVETMSDPQHVVTLGPPEDLPRPWDPSSCRDAELRREVWQWLDQVVDWINIECCWDVADMIPGCWYLHPHLVHDLGAVADQRRRAALAFTSDALEEWQRQCLPLFVQRTRARVKAYCEETHKNPPGRGRLARYNSIEALAERHAWFDSEVRDHGVPDPLEPSDEAYPFEAQDLVPDSPGHGVL